MKRETKLLFIFSFSVLILVLEVTGGLLSRSLALLSDAGHMLTDALSVFLSYLAIRWSKKPATAQRTFGYHRTEILAALVNGLTLLAISGYIFYEAIRRFFQPEVIKVDILLIVAAVGLAGNLFGMLILNRESHDNLNIRSTFFHLLGDALSSLGVIVGGIVIMLTGWSVVDSLISVLIGGLVLRSAIDLIFESGEVLLEAVPRDIDIAALRTAIKQVPGVKGFHDVHIWTITSGRRALSGHLVVDNISIRESQQIICTTRNMLAEKFNITHASLETECDVCPDNVCEFTGEGKLG
jgi:cobalt-zinc-cadmium efflux system protein